MKLAAVVLALTIAYANATYSRIQLPYEQSALESAISTDTVNTHYEKHHAGYETNTNSVVSEINTFYKEKSGSDENLIKDDDKLEDVLYRLESISKETKKDDETIPEGSYSQLAQKLRNNGGGLINHNLYFESFKAYSEEDTTPASGSEIEAYILKQYGSFSAFKDALVASATSVFGSGWTFAYVKRHSEEVVIATYPNQDSPYMDGHFPFLGIDVWEHAYYLDQKNVRANYLQNIFKIFDWDVINSNYVQALDDAKNASGNGAVAAGTMIAIAACLSAAVLAFL